MLRLFVATWLIATVLAGSPLSADDAPQSAVLKNPDFRRVRRTAGNCLENIDGGSCKGNSWKWGYNADKGSCVPFIYRGCGGNSNRFKTFRDCTKHCKPTVPKVEIHPIPHSKNEMTTVKAE